MENHVVHICTAVPPENWKHCPGKDNPADIPSRGMTTNRPIGVASRSRLWLNGLKWLHSPLGTQAEYDIEFEVPRECLQEGRSKDEIAWKGQFRLFKDESNSDLPSSAKTLILLDKNPQITSQIIMDAHQHVMHNGVKETITELGSLYWLIQGRQID